MTIKGMPALLDIAKDYKQHIPVASLYGKRISIDTSLILMKLVTAMILSGTEIVNSQGKDVTHIIVIAKLIKTLMDVGITPVFVMEGKPPVEKDDVIADRKAKIEEARIKMESIEDKTSHEYRSLKSQSYKPSTQNFYDLMTMFFLFGVPFCHNKTMEADPRCVWLTLRAPADEAIYGSDNFALAAYPKDSDFFPLGAPYVIISSLVGLTADATIEVISLERVLSSVGYTQANLVEFALLSKSDYFRPGIKGIGGAHAYKIIQKHKTLEGYRDAVLKRLVQKRRLAKVETNKNKLPTSCGKGALTLPTPCGKGAQSLPKLDYVDITNRKDFSKEIFLTSIQAMINARKYFTVILDDLDRLDDIKAYNVFPHFCLKDPLLKFLTIDNHLNPEIYEDMIDKVLVKQQEMSQHTYFYTSKVID